MSKLLPSMPIGIFDSGVGGLTVLNAIHQILPNENLLYLGDTARVPYGTKSAETVIKYAINTSAKLVYHKIKLLVVACNTASSNAITHLQKSFPHIPIIGVLEPGAQAICKHSLNGHIGVIGTDATINTQAYQQAITKLRPDANVIAKSCGLFVALAEEGWASGPIPEAVAAEYLKYFLNRTPTIDSLLLGCTHFPLLKNAIQNVLGNSIKIIDSASTTALAVQSLLSNMQLLNESPDKSPFTFFVTDSPQRFIQTAKYFLDDELASNQVELIDI